MPQQRRKVPFSGKKKKDQLLQKRQTKSVTTKYLRHTNDSHEDGETTEDSELYARKLMEQPYNKAGGRNINRYNLQFYQESKKELEQIKLEGYKPFDVVNAKQREVDGHYFDGYDFPIRPPWDYEISKDLLDRTENRYFREYLDNLQKTHRNENKDLSLFELNLETWRQLWRVLEFSDILLIIVDVRYSTLMFPPSLYEYIVKQLKKHAILVLNKVDLVAPEVVVAWQDYFHETYPSLPIVLFASYPSKQIRGGSRRRIGHKRSMEGVHNIFRECQQIVQNEVELSSWEQKILEDIRDENICFDDDDKCVIENTSSESSIANEASSNSKKEPHVLFNDGILTIGCIGFPNVGKSSLINALKGKKVVSVSRTPGHTKHFQTIFLTNCVRLCDCPGLVFPSSTPKYLQVLLGSFPISQLQVPYRSLKFLAEHLNLPQILKIRLPEDFDEWSSVAIADAWAIKRGFLTAKAARPDRYRAANHLLRMCLSGQQGLILQFYPPGFEDQREKWLNHPKIDDIRKYQNDEIQKIEDEKSETSSINSESDEDDVEENSSFDETNLDEEDEVENSKPSTSKNAFAMLDDD